MVRAYGLLIQHGVPGEIYNIGSGTAVSIQSLLDEIIRQSGISISVQHDPQKFRPVDYPSIAADISKLQQAIDWKPEISLERTIADTLTDWQIRLKNNVKKGFNMEEHTEQKRVMADTYMEEVWEQQAVKNWSKPMHNFGVRQNAFNQSADQRIRALESENLQLRTQIRTLMQQTEELSQIAKRQKERLRQEEQRNREIFGRVAAMLDRMRNDLDRVRLSTQLNSNAIDRLMLEDAAEPEAIEEPLTTMEESEEELETMEETETAETVAAVASVEPEAEPEQVTESIEQFVEPEMPIEPKDSYAE